MSPHCFSLLPGITRCPIKRLSKQDSIVNNRQSNREIIIKKNKGGKRDALPLTEVKSPTLNMAWKRNLKQALCCIWVSMGKLLGFTSLKKKV